MSKRHFLDFEQPIAELETKIEELRFVQSESAVDISDEIGHRLLEVEEVSFAHEAVPGAGGRAQ